MISYLLIYTVAITSASIYAVLRISNQEETIRYYRKVIKDQHREIDLLRFEVDQLNSKLATCDVKLMLNEEMPIFVKDQAE